MSTTRVRRTRRHAAAPSSGRWVLTAPQLKPRTTRCREPWGIVHCRPDGTRLTACGQPSAQWFSLWEIPLDASAPNMCPGCLEEMARIARADQGTD